MGIIDCSQIGSCLGRQIEYNTPQFIFAFRVSSNWRFTDPRPPSSNIILHVFWTILGKIKAILTRPPQKWTRPKKFLKLFFRRFRTKKKLGTKNFGLLFFVCRVWIWASSCSFFLKKMYIQVQKNFCTNFFFYFAWNRLKNVLKTVLGRGGQFSRWGSVRRCRSRTQNKNVCFMK